MTQHCSIALATCNGAQYLQALLDSIAEQRLLPFELIAYDDASNDATLSILESFAARAPFKVRISRNPLRLGVIGNFSHAIAACNGDIIVLADQDDFWHPDKLAHLVEALKPHGMLAVFSDAQVVDADQTPLGFTMWERVHFTPHEQTRLVEGDGFGVLLKHHIVTGATMAFKTQLREMALPIPETWQHDAWLALIAAAYGGLMAIPSVLIDYRQHEQNVVGGRRRSFLQDAGSALRLNRVVWYQEEIARWQILKGQLIAMQASSAAVMALEDKLSHLYIRARLPKSRWRRLPSVWHEFASGRYASYARHWGSIAIDLLVR